MKIPNNVKEATNAAKVIDIACAALRMFISA